MLAAYNKERKSLFKVKFKNEYLSNQYLREVEVFDQ